MSIHPIPTPPATSLTSVSPALFRLLARAPVSRGNFAFSDNSFLDFLICYILIFNYFISYMVIFKKIFNVYLFLRGRQRQREFEWGKGRESETQKQGPVSYQPTAWWLGSNSRTRRSRPELNQQSHPDTPEPPRLPWLSFLLQGQIFPLQLDCKLLEAQKHCINFSDISERNQQC